MANLIDQCFISPGIGLHNVDIVGEMLVHLRENNYYKDHFCKVCTGNMAQYVLKPRNSCVCHRRSNDSLPHKFVKKSAVENSKVLSAVDNMLVNISSKFPGLLGCESNDLQFRRNIHHLLRFNKNQSVNSALLTRKLKMKPVAWLNQFTDETIDESTQMKLRTKTFYEFCVQFFNMVWTILRRHFHVALNRISHPVFYWKTHWHGLVHLHENQLEAKLTRAAIPDTRAKKIWWMPKGNTCLLRPIFLHKTQRGEAMNFHYMNFILNMLLTHTELESSRTTTKPSRDFHLKWKKFQKTWVEAGSPQMFLKLMGIVMKRMTQVFSAYPRLSLYRSYNPKKRKSVYWMKEMSSTLPSSSRDNEPLTPKLCREFTRKTLFRFVKTSLRQLFNSQVKIGKRHFQYTSGILQGHPLSSNLCEIYYGDIYQEYHHQLLVAHNEATTLLLTAMDDTILVTSDKDLAVRYLNFILDKEQCPVQMNLAKLQANLCPLDNGCTAGPTGPQNKKLFAFCGVNIHSETLNLSANYDNYRGRNIFYSFTFKEKNPSYMRVIDKKLNFFLPLKSHAMFFDRQINSIVTMARNVFELGVHLACRFNSLVLNFCIENYAQKDLRQMLMSTLKALSELIANKIRWKSDGSKHARVNLILVEALVFITQKYDNLHSLNRIQLKEFLASELVKARSLVSDRDLQRWIERFKTRSLVPKILMGGMWEL
ncbi:hypothetical protein M8J75_000249 [Diaphorina citri]|nr:hypothetical protein M8J75_000249 [Diaphorina citri]